MMENRNLFAEYLQTGSELVFRELVGRYVNFVYSAALRLVDGDTHRAEDVTQVVFLDLVRMAATLSAETMLGGWLHRHTCFVAANIMRGERRRRSREREAVEMNLLNNSDGNDFSHIGPILDEVINELGEADRTAIVLRFFEQRDFRSLGEALGSNEDAARMRVNRALEKLESFLKRRGITTTAATLALIVSASAVQPAPTGLTATILTAASTVTGVTLTTTAAGTATKTIAMTTLQKTIVGSALVVAVSVGLYQGRRVAVLKDQVAHLQQQQAVTLEQARRFHGEFEMATNQITALKGENERLKVDAAAVFKLRGELGRARTDSQELRQLKQPGNTAERELRSWLARTKELKELAAAMPDQQIPEMRFLEERDWLARGGSANVSNETQIRVELCELRKLAKIRFSIVMQNVLQQYVDANEQRLPTEVSQLKPFLPKSVDDSILQRYEVFRTGIVGKDWRPHQYVIREKAPVDSQFDARLYLATKNSGLLVEPFFDETHSAL